MRSKLYIIRYTLYILLSTILTTGCVLTMEDYTKIPEEERGVGQPYTYKDSLVTCTYEFREGVVPITDRWFPYVLGVVDSTVYISDNIPEDWLPKPGEYVSAGCSRTFPLGLCHRVQSMNRQSGMFAMTLTGATTDEVFKELDIVVDLDSYTLPGMDLTPDTTGQPNQIRRFTRGGEEDPHISVLPTGEIVDFRFVDAAMDTPEHKYLKPRTRGENNYITDGDHSVTDTDEDVDPVHWGCEFEFDPQYLAAKMGKNFPNLKPKLALSVDKNVHVVAHKDEWKSEKKSSEWNEKTVTTKWTAKVSLSYDLDKLGKSKPNMKKEDWRDVQRMLSYLKLQNPPKLRPKISTLLDPFYITFTVGAVPCSIRICFEINPTATLTGFGEFTLTINDEVKRVTSVRDGDYVNQFKTIIRDASSELSVEGGGSLEIGMEERISLGFCIGGKIGAVGFDVGGGSSQTFSIDYLTGQAKGTTDLMVDTVYDQSGIHFNVNNFVDFEIFLDWLGQPVASHRIRPEHLKWTPYTQHWYFLPVLDTKATNSTYNFDYSDPKNPVVHHTQKIVFSEGYMFGYGDDDVFPVLLVYKKRLESNPEVIAPDNYTGKKSRNADGYYPLEPKKTYNFKYDSDPRLEREIWFAPALRHKDGSIEEYRKMNRKWGGKDSKEGLVKHLELYQKSTNEKEDTKKLFDKDWDFYHMDDIIEVTSVPADYFKVGYIINVVDAKNRNVIKKSDVDVMGHGMSTLAENVVKAGTYKVSFDVGFPSDGRGPVTNPLFPSIKAYPILTVQPYYRYFDDAKQQEVKVMSDEKCISLKFPYTSDYSYKKADFTTKITKPIRE